MSGRIIVVVSDKGGVGKTTCATNVAHGLALRQCSGRALDTAHVLLVDFDLLGQDAIVLGMDPEPGVYEHFVLGEPACRVIRETGRSGLHLLPGNGWTRKADDELRARPIAETIDCLLALACEHDYTIIDTHPSGFLQEIAVRVADVVIAPVRCEALAMDGVAATLQLVREIGQPRQIVILPTMVDERLTAQRYNYALLSQAYPGMIAAPIPSRVAVAEAHAQGCTVWEYADRRGELAKVRSAYAQLIDWLTADVNELLFGQRMRP